MMTRRSRVTVVVPTFDGLKLFPTFVRSLDHTLQQTVPLLVIRHRNDELDDAEADAYDAWIEECRKSRPNTRIVPLSGAFNYSRMMNQALVHVDADSDYICLTNDDIVFASRGWLEHMLAPMQADPNVDIVGAKLVYPATEGIPGNDLIENPKTCYGTIQHAGVCLVQEKGSTHIYKGRPWDHPPTCVDRAAEAVTFALVLVRKSLFDQIAFDENLDCDFNDIDFCLQAAALGRGIVLCARSIHFHLETVTRRKYGHHSKADNKRYFMEKWRHRIRSAPDLDSFTRLEPFHR